MTCNHTHFLDNSTYNFNKNLHMFTIVERRFGASHPTILFNPWFFVSIRTFDIISKSIFESHQRSEEKYQGCSEHVMKPKRPILSHGLFGWVDGIQEASEAEPQ